MFLLYWVRNFENFYIKNCVIDGYYFEFYNLFVYLDLIRYLIIIDLIFLIDIYQLYDMMLNDFQLKFVYCGYEIYVCIIDKNIKFFFYLIIIMFLLEKMEVVLDVILLNIKNCIFVCNYLDYIEIELIGKDKVGKYVFDDIIENFLYLSLIRFNYLLNNINYFLCQLSKWWKYFLVLCELDFFNDIIKLFFFDYLDVN